MIMHHLLFFVLTVLLLSSCVVEEADLSRYTDEGVDNVEEARDIEVRYTDSSFLVLILKAPVSRRKVDRYAMVDEFPEGIEATFYDRSGKPRSWLTADYALRDQLKRTVTVQQNVVLRNDEGERLEGPELIWDEKSKEIYTDRFVKIIRADSSVIYSYGFKSNESFTRYELKAVSGDMTIEDDK